jgi:hypothetical protein
VAKHVPMYSKAWKARIPDGVVSPCPRFEAPPVHVCEERYGPGRCADTMDVAVKSNFDNFYRRFDRWSSITKVKPAAFDQPWAKQLPLFYVGDPLAQPLVLQTTPRALPRS